MSHLLPLTRRTVLMVLFPLVTVSPLTAGAPPSAPSSPSQVTGTTDTTTAAEPAASQTQTPQVPPEPQEAKPPQREQPQTKSPQDSDPRPQSYTDTDGKEYHPAPNIEVSALTGYADLPLWRQEVIREALEVRAECEWPRYLFGSADPAKGGFDCSGAMYYLLRRAGYAPARSSAGQYLWLEEQGTLHRVPNGTTSLDAAAFAELQPGDLVFWSGTYEPTDGRTVPVTHVGMYLGGLTDYHRPVMMCASKGRSFRGKRGDGFGIYDFKLPSPTSRTKIVAYGAVQKDDALQTDTDALPKEQRK